MAETLTKLYPLKGGEEEAFISEQVPLMLIALQKLKAAMPLFSELDVHIEDAEIGIIQFGSVFCVPRILERARIGGICQYMGWGIYAIKHIPASRDEPDDFVDVDLEETQTNLLVSRMAVHAFDIDFLRPYIESASYADMPED